LRKRERDGSKKELHYQKEKKTNGVGEKRIFQEKRTDGTKQKKGEEACQIGEVRISSI